MDVIKELGLEIKCAFLPNGPEDVVTVKDLRAAIEKLPVVYGFDDSEGLRFNDSKYDSDTHKARLICIEKSL